MQDSIWSNSLGTIRTYLEFVTLRSSSPSVTEDSGLYIKVVECLPAREEPLHRRHVWRTSAVFKVFFLNKLMQLINFLIVECNGLMQGCLYVVFIIPQASLMNCIVYYYRP